MATLSALDREMRVRVLPLVPMLIGMWLVQETKIADGNRSYYDLFKDGRIVQYDLDDLAECERRISQDGDSEYTLEEHDGYRTQRRISR